MHIVIEKSGKVIDNSANDGWSASTGGLAARPGSRRLQLDRPTN